MTDLNKSQGQLQQGQSQQGQGNRPFGAEDKEKRGFKILPLSQNEENVSYEVILQENEEGSVRTRHINKKFISAGVEITPTTVCGQCERCKEINLGSALIICGICGKRVCPKCRRKFSGKAYCKWGCVILAVCVFTIKGLVAIILHLFAILLKLMIRIIITPFKDIYREG